MEADILMLNLICFFLQLSILQSDLQVQSSELSHRSVITHVVPNDPNNEIYES